MEEQKLKIVDFDIAKPLKEIGFDWPCYEYWETALKSKKDPHDGYTGSFGWKKGETNLQTGYFTNNSKYDDSNAMWLMCAAPTQALVIKWFREVHDIHIQPTNCDFYDGEYVNHVGYRLNVIVGRNFTKSVPSNYILMDKERSWKYYGGLLYGHGIVFETYEDTEAEGIKLAIEAIKNKNR